MTQDGGKIEWSVRMLPGLKKFRASCKPDKDTKVTVEIEGLENFLADKKAAEALEYILQKRYLPDIFAHHEFVAFSVHAIEGLPEPHDTGCGWIDALIQTGRKTPPFRAGDIRPLP